MWTFAARQTTRYDTTYQTDLRPSNDVLFITQAHDSIYKHGGVKTDVTLEKDGWEATQVESIWKSGPLFRSADLWGISHLGMWKESNDTHLVEIILYGYDGTAEKTLYDSTQCRYKKLGMLSGESYYWQLRIRTSETDSLAIQGLDLWPEYKGKAQEY